MTLHLSVICFCFAAAIDFIVLIMGNRLGPDRTMRNLGNLFCSLGFMTLAMGLL